MREMDHPNVIRLLEVYDSTKYIHLLLPYIGGGELFKEIKKRHLYTQAAAIPLMKDLLSALAYLHENLIVHRDLKPENLILDSETNRLIVADFGLATKLKDKDEKLYLRCGSPGYVSPELLQDLGYNCTSDIFSAGVIFFVILTGRPLFKGTNHMSILRRNMVCDFDIKDSTWKSLSVDAADLVKKMLIEKQEDRISAKDALKHRLFTEAANLSVSHSPQEMEE